MKNKFLMMRALLRNNAFRVSFFKYLGGAVGTVLVAFFIFGMLYYNLYTAYLRHTQAIYHERNLYRTSAAVSYLMDNVEQNYELIAADGHITALLTTLADALPNVRRTEIRACIDGLFEKTVLSPAMDSIYVYSELNGHVITWTEFRTLESFSDGGAFDEGSAVAAREKWTNTGMPNVITVRRPLTHEGRRIGMVAFNLEYDSFTEYVNQNTTAVPQDLYITDGAGTLFFAGDIAALNSAPLARAPYVQLIAQEAETGDGVLFEDSVVYAMARAADGGHIVYGAMNETAVLGFARDFTWLAVTSGVIGLLIAFCVAFVIAYRLFRNIVRLLSAIGAPYDKELSGEMNYIAANIAGLTARNTRIEHELAEKLAELKKAQAIALQNQINPHFILNTLQIVNLDIMQQIGGDSAATQVIAMLSDILKSNLNTTDYLVPLEYEIRQAMKYIGIENLRSKERLHADFDIDEPLTAYRTVKFILQPVLENCVKHAFTGRETTLRRVTVSGKREGRFLVLCIRDNGAGMTAEALTELQARLAHSHIQENRHIGLCNVDKRIKLVFGDECGVSVTSDENVGTVVTIRQRLVRGDWK